MITITGIVGTASDPRFAERLHHLEHDNRVETLVVGESVRRLTMERADAGAIRSAALADGMVSLRADGARSELPQ